MSSAREVIKYAIAQWLVSDDIVPSADAILRALDAAGKKIVDTAEWEELNAFRASLEEAAQWLSEHDVTAAGSGE